MKFHDIKDEDILEAAKQQFSDYFIEVDSCDLFLSNVEDGEYQADFFSHPFYVSTQYAYEDHLVNGNKTRYKITIPVILLKKDRFEIIYDFANRYYAVYEEEGKLHFIKYGELQPLLAEQLHKVS